MHFAKETKSETDLYRQDPLNERDNTSNNKTEDEDMSLYTDTSTHDPNPTNDSDFQLGHPQEIVHFI